MNRTNRASNRHTLVASPPGLTTLAVSLAMLGACSSSDNDDNDAGDSNNQTPVVLTSSTEELKTRAINASGRSFGSTLSGMQQLASTENTGAELTQGENPAQDFLASTLALDDVGNAVTTREDNRVLIDPDESQLCAEEFADTLDVNEDRQRCETLLADLNVELIASSDEAGIITYLFQQNPVISLGYGNGVDSLALNLGGLKLFADANDALDPNSFGESSTPDTMAGEISFTASNTNNTSGEEAGSITIAVTQPIAISSLDANLSLANGELFSISADSGSGHGEMSFNIGAIAATAPFRDEDIASLNLDGFTGSASLDLGENAAEAPATITVSNLGIGRGPLQMNINDQEALRLTMETFGFTVTSSSSALNENGSAVVQIDNTMDIALMLNNAAGFDLDANPSLQAMLSLQAPGGTVISDGGDAFDAPELRVIQGGPFILSMSSSDDQSSEEQSITINAGECLFSGSGSSSSEAVISADGTVIFESEMSTSSEQRVEACP